MFHEHHVPLYNYVGDHLPQYALYTITLMLTTICTLLLVYYLRRYVFGAFTHFKSGKYELPGPTPKVFYGNYKELSKLPGV